MTKEIEFVALPYPLPEAVTKELRILGHRAINARAMAVARVEQTPEGQALADYEADLRASIGVLHRRPQFGSVAP